MNRFKERLKQYPIKRKMRCSVGVITLVAVIIGVMLLAGMLYISTNIKGIFVGPMTNISDVNDVKYALTDLQREINSLITDGPEELPNNYNDFETNSTADVKTVTDAVASMEKHFTTKAGKEKLAELKDKINEGEQIRPQLMELLQKGKFEEADDLNDSTYYPIVEDIKGLTEELEQLINANGQGYYVRSVLISNILFFVGVALIVALLILSTVLTKIITEILTVPAKELVEAANLMFEGDMSAGERITYESEDEFGHMAESMRGSMKILQAYIIEISDTLRQIAGGDLTKNWNDITDFKGDFVSIKESFVYILKHFNDTLSHIQETSAQVESGAADISKAADEQSVGSTEQASAVEELTATIETVANLAETSANEAQQAYDKITVAVETANGERQKMDDLTAEMQSIIDISKKIEEITTAIEDIASQTSLLALNASIEAARAGDAGKGFAVVAEQIGKLASDSSQSAVSTRELIGKTMEEINKGSDITASVAVAFENTINELQNFAESAKATNETSRNQAEVLAQIEGGIEQISGATQNNAAAAEESSAISQELATHAKELDKLIAEFQLYQA